MNALLVSIVIGLLIGLINIVPMVLKKLPSYTTAASFVHYFFTSIVIAHVHIPYLPWWLKGGVLGLALMIPMLIHVGHSDKKPLPIIAANSVIFGSMAGIASHYFMS